MMGQNEALVLRAALQFVPMGRGLIRTSPKGPEKPRVGLPAGVDGGPRAVGTRFHSFRRPPVGQFATVNQQLRC